MAEWKRVRGDKGTYLRFEAGKSFEGIYQGYKERDNPFYDEKNPNSPSMIVDYILEIKGEQKTLSSTAQTLRDQLMPLIVPCNVKIDCIAKGIKKFYTVWTQ